MVYTLILSGGKGVRLGTDIPKQYIEVNKKPIIGYCIDEFQKHPLVDRIVIVSALEWNDLLQSYISAEKINKCIGFANSGISRQHSILSGLSRIKELGGRADDKIIIHDAARPRVSPELITRCISILEHYDCAMPVLPMKDTVYLSEDGRKITSLLNRETIFAGQAPEGVHLGTYYNINICLTDEELCMVKGTSSIAFQKGLSVGLFPGDESNYKITTIEDLNRFLLEYKQ